MISKSLNYHPPFNVTSLFCMWPDPLKILFVFPSSPSSPKICYKCNDQGQRIKFISNPECPGVGSLGCTEAELNQCLLCEGKESDVTTRCVLLAWELEIERYVGTMNAGIGGFALSMLTVAARLVKH
jgi:hypothetical protein